MPVDTFPATPDPAEHSLSVAGVRLAAIVESAGPFGSLFVGPGVGLRARAQVAIDGVPVPAPHAGKLLSAIEDSQARSQVAISDGNAVWRFLLEDPLAIDLARFGEIPSLGPIIEASQVTTPHVVVTIEDDVYGLTSFGTVDSTPAPVSDELAPLPDPPIFEALDHLVDALRSSHVRLVAMIGSGAAIEDVRNHLQLKLPLMLCNGYPTNDIDRDLLSIADDVVKDAASLAAERRTHELAHFRQARTAAQTREGAGAIAALEAGSAQRLLVHDDLGTDREADGSRPIDRAIVAAIRSNVPITMIPNVPDDRGPSEGLGVIVKGEGTAVPATASDPEGAGHVQLRV